jgi:Zn-finger protein
VKNIPIYLSGNMKEFEWKKLEKGRIVWKCEGCFNKMKNIWKNDEFD